MGWSQLAVWMDERKKLPPGPGFCVVHGPTAGRELSGSAVREELKALQRAAGVRRRIAPHQFHVFSVELVREGAPAHILQRQIGHANLAVTTLYLSSVAPKEVLEIA